MLVWRWITALCDKLLSVGKKHPDIMDSEGESMVMPVNPVEPPAAVSPAPAPAPAPAPVPSPAPAPEPVPAVVVPEVVSASTAPPPGVAEDNRSNFEKFGDLVVELTDHVASVKMSATNITTHQDEVALAQTRLEKARESLGRVQDEEADSRQCCVDTLDKMISALRAMRVDFGG